jgi:hypothetical protein
MTCGNSRDQDRIRAAEILMDRGWGKAVERYAVEGQNGQRLMRIVHEFGAGRAGGADHQDGQSISRRIVYFGPVSMGATFQPYTAFAMRVGEAGDATNMAMVSSVPAARPSRDTVSSATIETTMLARPEVGRLHDENEALRSALMHCAPLRYKS